ncbi:probable RNA-binding protein EIF1AD [Helianthus annuus]|uniref:probable RNA-binding protein EIF1AD n=1 Tax=Helianthus annuus TaxID=4232 RepID=UPI000B8FCC89|nr:probable RNA-binding protein EIF1AD [Helianthus annuus]
MSNLPPEANLQEDLKEDIIKLILSEKFYPATAEKFQDWPLVALKTELNRIERIKRDPGMKRSAPNWSKYKKKIDDLTLEYKRKKQELVDAKVGTAKAISKWTRQYTDEAYERLRKRRETDPKLPKKPDYKTTAKPKQQAHTSEPLFTSSDTSTIVVNQRKRQKLTDEEEKEQEVVYFKEAIKTMALEDDNSAKIQNIDKQGNYG